MSGAITEEDRTFTETWQNIAEFTNVIIRLDVRGDEKQEVITGERTFMVTSEERLITQGKILDKANDPFLNGSFRPVIVPDSISIESNPNALSDEDILKIFTSSDLAYDEWIKSIDSPSTLDRMMRMAEGADELTMRRFKLLKERWDEMHPKRRITTSDKELAAFIGHEERKPVSATERKQGGRSSDYR